VGFDQVRAVNLADILHLEHECVLLRFSFE